jgi:hypothetical protein
MMPPTLVTHPTNHPAAMDDDTLMREWACGPFRLELHEVPAPQDDRRHPERHTPIGYRFYHDDQLIFEGDDIGVPAHQSLDGDQTVRGVLGFLAFGGIHITGVTGQCWLHGTPESPARTPRSRIGSAAEAPCAERALPAVLRSSGYPHLALRPGGVEPDYFAGYTPTQLAWRDQHAEDLEGLLAEWPPQPPR